MELVSSSQLCLKGATKTKPKGGIYMRVMEILIALYDRLLRTWK